MSIENRRIYDNRVAAARTSYENKLRELNRLMKEAVEDYEKATHDAWKEYQESNAGGLSTQPEES